MRLTRCSVTFKTNRGQNETKAFRLLRQNNSVKVPPTLNSPKHPGVLPKVTLKQQKLAAKKLAAAVKVQTHMDAVVAEAVAVTQLRAAQTKAKTAGATHDRAVRTVTREGESGAARAAEAAAATQSRTAQATVKTAALAHAEAVRAVTHAKASLSGDGDCAIRPGGGASGGTTVGAKGTRLPARAKKKADYESHKLLGTL